MLLFLSTFIAREKLHAVVYCRLLWDFRILTNRLFSLHSLSVMAECMHSMKKEH